MPLQKKDAVVSTERDLTTEVVKVSDIVSCDEEKVLPSGNSIKFPYKISIVDKKGVVVFEEATTGTMKPRSKETWFKKFYLNKSGFVGYSRNNSLLAILGIMQKKSGKPLDKEVNLNDLLIGFEFEAVVVRGDGIDPFINWASTLEINKVAVPQEGQLKTTGYATQEAAVQEVFKDDDDPLKDLPF